ncbi:unnamed protein product [Caenorhabditis brenneri]
MTVIQVNLYKHRMLKDDCLENNESRSLRLCNRRKKTCLVNMINQSKGVLSEDLSKQCQGLLSKVINDCARQESSNIRTKSQEISGEVSLSPRDEDST